MVSVLVLRKGTVPLVGDGLILGAFLSDEITGFHCCHSLRLIGRFIGHLCHGRSLNYMGQLSG